MKKTFSIFLSIIMVISIVTPFFAYANDNDINNYLLAHGFTESYISNMSQEDKEFYYEQGCTVIEMTEYSYDENMNLLSVNDLTKGEQTCTPYGLIPTSKLSLVLTLSKNSSGHVIVELVYSWKSLPLNRYQDPIGISWDSNIFTMKDNSFIKEDYYLIDNSTSILFNKETRPGQLNANGVVWYANLYSSNCTGLRGKGRCTLIPKKSNVNTTLYYNYIHKKMGTSLSLSIPGFGSFSVSGNSTYDECANQKTFKV